MTDPITVMIVDDHEMVRRGACGYLEAHPDISIVAQAGTGEEAVKLAQEFIPDVVLMDLVMPGMGGVEAYDSMKEINPNIKVLLSSGYSIDSKTTEIMKRDCDGFIQKPFNMKELSGEIRKILGKE